MTATEKAKIKKLMSSKKGLIRASCAAAGIPVDTYYNVMQEKSKNIEALNKIIEKAKELKDVKVQVAI